VVREEPFDPFAADMWSLGVCLYSLLTGRPLYNSPRDKAFDIMSHPEGIKEVIEAYEGYGLVLPSPQAKHLICHMMDSDPRQRPTLEDLLQHPFLEIPLQEK